MSGNKREVFAEISEGLAALEQRRVGKVTLRTHVLELPTALEITAADLLRLRESLNLSRAVFARRLRTNPRTLENWELGRAKPNAQATLLIKLVEQFPDTVERLAAL